MDQLRILEAILDGLYNRATLDNRTQDQQSLARALLLLPELREVIEYLQRESVKGTKRAS